MMALLISHRNPRIEEVAVWMASTLADGQGKSSIPRYPLVFLRGAISWLNEISSSQPLSHYLDAILVACLPLAFRRDHGYDCSTGLGGHWFFYCLLEALRYGWYVYLGFNLKATIYAACIWFYAKAKAIFPWLHQKSFSCRRVPGDLRRWIPKKSKLQRSGLAIEPHT